MLGRNVDGLFWKRVALAVSTGGRSAGLIIAIGRIGWARLKGMRVGEIWFLMLLIDVARPTLPLPPITNIHSSNHRHDTLDIWISS